MTLKSSYTCCCHIIKWCIISFTCFCGASGSRQTLFNALGGNFLMALCYFLLRYARLWADSLHLRKLLNFTEQCFGRKFVQYPAAEISKLTQMFLFTQSIKIAMRRSDSSSYLQQGNTYFIPTAPSHRTLFDLKWW